MSERLPTVSSSETDTPDVEVSTVPEQSENLPESRLGNSIMRGVDRLSKFATLLNEKLVNGVERREAAKAQLKEIGSAALLHLQNGVDVTVGFGILGVEAAGKGIDKGIDYLDEKADLAVDKAKDLVESAKSSIDNASESVKSKAESAKDSFDDKVDSVKEKTKSVYDSAQEKVGEKISSIREALKQKRDEAEARKLQRASDRQQKNADQQQRQDEWWAEDAKQQELLSQQREKEATERQERRERTKDSAREIGRSALDVYKRAQAAGRAAREAGSNAWNESAS